MYCEYVGKYFPIKVCRNTVHDARYRPNKPLNILYT